MFSTIVVGTDGSQDAEEAVRAAAELAASNPGTAVHVVNAYHPLSAAEIRAIASELPKEFHPLLHTHVGADTTLASARTILQAAGVEAEYHEIDDRPADAILDLVDKHGADLVVVGSRGEGAAKRALHGSVSTKVVHHAPSAVLVVKADR